jgi:hypothetical protein
MRWAGHVARMEAKMNAYRLLLGKPEGRRSLGRPRRRWLNIIRMDLVEVGWGDVDWIGLAQDRDRWRALVNSVWNLWAPENAGKLSSAQTTRDPWSSAQLHGVSYSWTSRCEHRPYIRFLWCSVSDTFLCFYNFLFILFTFRFCKFRSGKFE